MLLLGYYVSLRQMRGYETVAHGTNGNTLSIRIYDVVCRLVRKLHRMQTLPTDVSTGLYGNRRDARTRHLANRKAV